MRRSWLIPLCAPILAACSPESVIVDLDLRRDPCNEAAGECCETTDLLVRSSRLELVLGGDLRSGPCQPVADLTAVAPIGRPLVIEQALAAGAITDLAEGQWEAKVVGFDQPGCAAGRLVLCGRGRLTLPPGAARGRLPLVIRCSPGPGSPKQASVDRCMTGP